MNRVKRIAVAIVSGFVILVITWKYQNYDYTLKLEDEFFKKVFLFKDKIYSPKPKVAANFVFINTGKDLALVEDTIEYGNVAVSDREKIGQLMTFMNSLPNKPDYCVLDIQFYFPYTINPAADSVLQHEIARFGNVVLPILKDQKGNYKAPLYKARYAHSDYRTFSATFNKFRIMIQEDVVSIPLVMHQEINDAQYTDHLIYPTCNGHLCLSAIWPSYFIKDGDLKKSTSVEELDQITQVSKKAPAASTIGTEYYNMGELLFDIEANPANYESAFKNKVVIVGNFQEDVHTTPIGKLSGPVLLANIYLSLANGQHIVSPWLLLLMVLSFSALSYVAIYEKMPEINITFKFLFSSYLTKFIRNYISYFGAMFLVSMVALIFFNVQVALFLPSAIFSCIEYVKEKKYLDLKK